MLDEINQIFNQKPIEQDKVFRNFKTSLPTFARLQNQIILASNDEEFTVDTNGKILINLLKAKQTAQSSLLVHNTDFIKFLNEFQPPPQDIQDIISYNIVPLKVYLDKYSLEEQLNIFKEKFIPNKYMPIVVIDTVSYTDNEALLAILKLSGNVIQSKIKEDHSSEFSDKLFEIEKHLAFINLTHLVTLELSKLIIKPCSLEEIQDDIKILKSEQVIFFNHAMFLFNDYISTDQSDISYYSPFDIREKLIKLTAEYIMSKLKDIKSDVFPQILTTTKKLLEFVILFNKVYLTLCKTFNEYNNAYSIANSLPFQEAQGDFFAYIVAFLNDLTSKIHSGELDIKEQRDAVDHMNHLLFHHFPIIAKKLTSYKAEKDSFFEDSLASKSILFSNGRITLDTKKIRSIANSAPLDKIAQLQFSPHPLPLTPTATTTSSKINKKTFK